VLSGTSFRLIPTIPYPGATSVMLLMNPTMLFAFMSSIQRIWVVHVSPHGTEGSPNGFGLSIVCKLAGRVGNAPTHRDLEFRLSSWTTTCYHSTITLPLLPYLCQGFTLFDAAAFFCLSSSINACADCFERSIWVSASLVFNASSASAAFCCCCISKAT